MIVVQTYIASSFKIWIDSNNKKLKYVNFENHWSSPGNILNQRRFTRGALLYMMPSAVQTLHVPRKREPYWYPLQLNLYVIIWPELVLFVKVWISNDLTRSGFSMYVPSESVGSIKSPLISFSKSGFPATLIFTNLGYYILILGCAKYLMYLIEKNVF